VVSEVADMGSGDESMTVEFEATLDEWVDVHVRTFRRSGTVRRWRWQETVCSAALAGVAAYLVSPDPLGSRLVGAAAGVTIALVLAPVLQRWNFRRRLRGYGRELLAGRDTFKVRVRVGPDGVWSESLGADALVRWEHVAEVEGVDQRVDIWVRPSGLITVRQRAFKSAADKDRFVAMVERYLAEAASGTGRAGGG
jgi:hypothetical protein